MEIKKLQKTKHETICSDFQNGGLENVDNETKKDELTMNLHKNTLMIKVFIDNAKTNCLRYLVVLKIRVSQRQFELNDELYYKLNHMSHAISGEWKSISGKSCF